MFINLSSSGILNRLWGSLCASWEYAVCIFASFESNSGFFTLVIHCNYFHFAWITCLLAWIVKPVVTCVAAFSNVISLEYVFRICHVLNRSFWRKDTAVTQTWILFYLTICCAVGIFWGFTVRNVYTIDTDFYVRFQNCNVFNYYTIRYYIIIKKVICYK